MALQDLQIILGDIFNEDGKKHIAKFNTYANYVSNMYFSVLPKLEIIFLKKIVIELFDDVRLTDNFIIPNTDVDNICTIKKSFDFLFFLAKDHDNKIKYLTEILYQSLIFISKELNWDSEVFQVAFDTIINNNFKKLALVVMAKSNKLYKAEITLEEDLESVHIYVIFFDLNNKEINKIKIFETLPQSYLYNQFIGKGKWLDKSTFCLRNKSNELTINISISGVIDIEFHPNQRSVEEFIEELIFISKNHILPAYFKTPNSSP